MTLTVDDDEREVADYAVANPPYGPA